MAVKSDTAISPPARQFRNQKPLKAKVLNRSGKALAFGLLPTLILSRFA